MGYPVHRFGEQNSVSGNLDGKGEETRLVKACEEYAGSMIDQIRNNIKPQMVASLKPSLQAWSDVEVERCEFTSLDFF